MLPDRTLPASIVMPAQAEAAVMPAKAERGPADTSDRGIDCNSFTDHRRQARRACRVAVSMPGNGPRPGGRGDGFLEDVA